MTLMSRLRSKQELHPDRRHLLGMIRRMAVRFTDRVLWQLTGHTLEGVQETAHVEPFLGLGFYARPRAGSRTAEAILVSIGGASHAVIVATRDEAVRELYKAELDGDDNAGVSAMFNVAAIVLIKPDGTVEIRTREGVAVPLAKASELQALATHFYGHTHLEPGAPPIATFDPLDPPVDPPALANPGQPGTETLRAE